MSCFRYQIVIPDTVRESFPSDNSSSASFLHHLSASKSEPISTMSIIGPAIQELRSARPHNQIKTARTICLTLKALMEDSRVKQSLGEFYGLQYLHDELEDAINSGDSKLLIKAADKINHEMDQYHVLLSEDGDASVAIAS